MAEITIRISDRALKLSGALLGVALLALGFSHLWSSGALRPKYQIKLFVPESEGLRLGAPVKLDGLQVGNVSRVEIANQSADSNRRIEVDLRIEKRFQNVIRDDSNASLVRASLLGDRYVNIHAASTGVPIQSGGVIRFVPAKEITFTDLINVIGKQMDCMTREKNSTDKESPSGAKNPQ